MILKTYLWRTDAYGSLYTRETLVRCMSVMQS